MSLVGVVAAAAAVIFLLRRRRRKQRLAADTAGINNPLSLNPLSLTNALSLPVQSNAPLPPLICTSRIDGSVDWAGMPVTTSAAATSTTLLPPLMAPCATLGDAASAPLPPVGATTIGSLPPVMEPVTSPQRTGTRNMAALQRARKSWSGGKLGGRRSSANSEQTTAMSTLAAPLVLRTPLMDASEMQSSL